MENANNDNGFENKKISFFLKLLVSYPVSNERNYLNHYIVTNISFHTFTILRSYSKKLSVHYWYRKF